MTNTNVTIDLRQLDIEWQKDKDYTISFDRGFVREIGNNRTLSDTQTNVLNADNSVFVHTFATDPTLVNITPVTNTTNIANPLITLDYDRTIFQNSGTFVIKNLSGQSLYSLSMLDNKITLLDNNTISINLNGINTPRIFNGGEQFYINITPNYASDIFNFAAPAIENTSTIRYTYKTAPVVQSVNPVLNTSNTFTNKVLLTFDRNISKNINSLKLYRSDLGLIKTIPISDNSIINNGNTATINFFNEFGNYSEILDGGETFYLTMEYDNFVDEYNLPSVAVSNDSLIKFTQLPKPTIVSISPAYGSTSTFVNNISITYNRPIQKGSGNVYLYRDTNPDILFFNQSVSTSSITIAGFTATISLNLPEDNYYLIHDYGVFKDSNSIKVNSINDDTVIKFTQKCVSGLTDRSYYINNENAFFNGTTPLILDTDTSSSYTITLSTTLGEFADDEYGFNRSMNWSYTGTKSQVNAKFSTIKFFPTKDTNASGTYTYTQTKGSLLQVNRSFNLTASTQTLLLTTSTYTFNTSGTWTPLYKYTKYGFADILVVGAGGAGSPGFYDASLGHIPGSGGGGGGVIELINSTVTQKTYSITVGSGGSGSTSTSGTTGGNTIFDTLTAYGGQGGQRSGTAANLDLTTRGGTSGAPTANTGITNSPGGGGGAGGSPGGGANGGIGILSTILNSYVADGGGAALAYSGIQGFSGAGGTGGAGARVPQTGPITAAGSGTANRGGGGGGGANVSTRNTNTPGGAGGSGVVIVVAHPEVEPSTISSISLDTYSYARYKSNGSNNDQPVTSTISVAGVYYTNKPVGVVTLYDNSSNVLGTGTLVVSTTTSISSTTISWYPIAAGQTTGTNTIKAIYNGDGFNKASSATQFLSIYNPTFQGALTVDSSSAFTGGTRIGQHVGPVTLISTFESASFAPSTVSFYRQGNILLGTTSTSAGVASLTVELPVGNHTITTIFSPTTIYQTTNSLPITVTSGGQLGITSAVRTPSGYTYTAPGQTQTGVIDVANNGSLTVTMTLTVPDLLFVPAKYKSNLLTGSGSILANSNHYNDSVLYQVSGSTVVISFTATYTHNNNIAGSFVGLDQYFSYSSNSGMFIIGGDSNATFRVPIHILR